jgi:hypothetical protein
MAATLLELCRRVADACNVPRPVAVALNVSDPTARRMLSCAREEIRLLAAAGDWQELRREVDGFALTPGVRGYPPASMAPDIDRIVDRTMRLQNRNIRLEGPVSPQRWAELTSVASPGSPVAFRVMGGDIVFTPTPSAAETISFEYVSDAPVLAADGVTRRRTWEADTDAPLLDDHLVEIGMRWRFMASLNLEHAQVRALYEQERQARLARGGGADVVSLVPRHGGGAAFGSAPAIDWHMIELPAGQL